MSFYKKVWYFTFNVGCIPTRPVTGCIQDWMHLRLIDFSRRDNSLAGVRHGWQSKVNAFLIIITTLDMLIQHCQMLICRWWLHYFWLKSESHVKSFLMIFRQIISNIARDTTDPEYWFHNLNHQQVPLLELVTSLAAGWRHLHCLGLPYWQNQLVSSAARVTSVKSAKGSVSERHSDP